MKHKLLLILFALLFAISIQQCFAQFNFIGRKINPNQPKSVYSPRMKSDKSIPNIDAKFDSIRQLTELTTGNGEAYPWISPDGNRIYYSEGSGGYVNIKIRLYMAEKQAGQYKFLNPQPLSINSKDSIVTNFSSWLTDDELNIYFITFIDSASGISGLYHATRNSISQDFSTSVQVKLIGINPKSIAGPSFTQDLNNLYLFNANYNGSNPHIFIFNKTADDEYTLTDTLIVPKNYTIVQGTLTSDGLKYYFSLLDSLNNCRIYVYIRDSINEKFSKLYYVNNPYINDTNVDTEITPYYSISTKVFNFVKAISNYWNDNNLYVSYNFNVQDNVIEHKENNITLNIYPNPFDNYIKISPSNISHSFEYNLSNIQGQLIKKGSFTVNTTLDVSFLSKGLFVLNILDKTVNLISYHKIIKI